VRVLDFGCRDGEFGSLLVKYRNVDYVGVDKSIEAVESAMPGILIKELSYPLPFQDNEFDVVMMFEVLEHIHEQDKVLLEVSRVLRRGGLVLISVPRKHLFSFLDLANFKFVFPRVHRYYYSLTRSSDAYHNRYGSNPSGLIGDIEKEKRWHQHFSDSDMRDLLERNGFTIVEIDGYGLFSLLFTFLSHVLRLGFLFPQKIRNWDSRTFHRSGLLCAANKS
jgi:SAM-dependent methyltransferase